MINSLYDNFKHWSANGSVYIISDTHFDDPDTKIMDSSWPSAEEQVNILKKYVTKNDTLIHLGDVGNTEWITKLKCYKVLIMGNHDVGKSKYLREEDYSRHYARKEDALQAITDGEIETFTTICDTIIGIKDNHLFDEVYEGALMIGEKILLSHEPIEGLPFVLNIHGHDHAGRYIDDNHINMASNICEFKPLNLGKYIEKHGLADIKSIHRITIDNTVERKKNNENICSK